MELSLNHKRQVKMLPEPLIRVYEYEGLSLLNRPDLKKALDSFYGDKGVPYYDLTRSGVRFKNYVGVIQVGRFTIEILPKIDRQNHGKDDWQRVLITMLRQSGLLKTDVPSSSNLKLKSNSILQLYINLYLLECESLIYKGLIKKYRKIEGNRTALRGALVMSKHLSKNIVHKERFYVADTIYSADHVFNQILIKGLQLVKSISSSSSVISKVESLLLNFPEVGNIIPSDKLFDTLVYNRKSQPYKKAMDIAKLLLLNYHPDIVKGRENVLALMFDMNKLWESWVLKQMQQYLGKEFIIGGQQSKGFWFPENGRTKSLIPDIVVENRATKEITIVDTKWKLPKDDRPSDEDLKQMFTYNKRFRSSTSILLYPGKREGYSGSFFHEDHGNCRVSFLNVLDENGVLDPSGILGLKSSII